MSLSHSVYLLLLQWIGLYNQLKTTSQQTKHILNNKTGNSTKKPKPPTHKGRKHTSTRSEDVKTDKMSCFDPDFSCSNLYFISSSAALRTSCHTNLTLALLGLNRLNKMLLVETDLTWSLKVFSSFIRTHPHILPAFLSFISSSLLFREQTHLCPPPKELTWGVFTRREE